MKTIKLYRNYKIVRWEDILDKPTGTTEHLESDILELSGLTSSLQGDVQSLSTSIDSVESEIPSYLNDIQDVLISSVNEGEVLTYEWTTNLWKNKPVLSLLENEINKLYTPDGNDAFVFTDSGKNLHIQGNIIQSGSTFNTDVETLRVADNYIILRSGATHGLTPGEFTGMEAHLYNGSTSGRLVYDSGGTARVGDVGDEQPLTTRIENPTDGQYAKWDDTNKRLEFGEIDLSGKVDKTTEGFGGKTKIENTNDLIEIESRNIANPSYTYTRLGFLQTNYVLEQLHTLHSGTTRGIYMNSVNLTEGVGSGDSTLRLRAHGWGLGKTPNDINVLTDKTLASKQIEYTSDVSASYTDRSLIDKGYLDTEIGKLDLSGKVDKNSSSSNVNFNELKNENGVFSNTATRVGDGRFTTMTANYFEINLQSFQGTGAGNTPISILRLSGNDEYSRVGVFGLNGLTFNYLDVYSNRTMTDRRIDYKTDVKGTYTDRSLIDKGYLDTRTDGLSFWKGTQGEYNLLTPDPNTIYFIE